MTDHTQSEHRLSEHDVESLLQRFFAEEMPAEHQSHQRLLVTSAINRVVAELPTSSKESRQLASYMALAVSTICCLLVVFLSPDDESSTVNNPLSSQGSPTDDAVDFVPVEDREHLSFSKLGGVEDPDSEKPTSEEAIVPELEVEIFPLQPDKPKSVE